MIYNHTRERERERERETDRYLDLCTCSGNLGFLTSDMRSLVGSYTKSPSLPEYIAWAILAKPINSATCMTLFRNKFNSEHLLAMKFILVLLAALLLFQTLCLTAALRPLLRASGVSEKDKTGCYIVVLKEETSHEMFQSIVSQVVQMSTDAQVHGSVERVAKAFTVKLSDDALQVVNCH